VRFRTVPAFVRPFRAGAILAAAVLAGTLLTGAPAGAIQPGERLADPALEARARELSRDLRCVVCQNQSIDDSNAELARDLRVLVRQRLKAGDTDRQVIDYVVSRYGDFVLLKPPLKPETWALWFGPAAMLVLGGLAVGLYVRRRRRPGLAGGGLAGEGGAGEAAAPLSRAEEDRIARVIEEHRR
jgi:cytochrome c-type biogenesis protein CcmH